MLRALLLLSLVASTARAADPAIPAPFPESRYAAMLADAPFAIASAAAPALAPPQPSFAANLYVTGVARIGDRDFVTISTRDRTSRFSLVTGEPSANADGIEVVKVDWSDEVGKGKVSVKKGSEFATIEFDQAELSKAPPVPMIRPGGQPSALPIPTSPRPVPRRRTLVIPSAPR